MEALPDGGLPRAAAPATTTVKETEDPPSGDPERKSEKKPTSVEISAEIQQFFTDRYKLRAMVVTPSDQLPS